MRPFIIFLLLFANPVLCLADLLSLDQTVQSTCKISIPKRDMFGNIGYSYGSGTVISSDDEYYYILTNGHVIKDAKSVLVEFFHNGHKSASASVDVKWVRYRSGTSIDAALLSVKKSIFGEIHPVVIPLADKNIKLASGNYVYGAGCPEGRWGQMWEGRVIEILNNVTHINHPPVAGQSGSALLANVKDDNGDVNTRVVGLVSWRVSDRTTQYGACVSLSRLHEIFTGVPSVDRIDTSYSHPISSFIPPNEICKTCGKPFSEHYIFPNGNGELLKRSDGSVKTACPSDKWQQNGIKTKELMGHCPTCPNGQCPLLPWNGGYHHAQPQPIEPAPVSPHGIWNIPKEDQKTKVPSIASIKKEHEEELQDLKNQIQEIEKQNESTQNEKQTLLSKINDITLELSNTSEDYKNEKLNVEKLVSELTNVSNENEKLQEDNIYKNVSFTAAGVASTAGVWFLKSYLLPAVLGSFSNRRKREEKEEKVRHRSDDSGYNINSGTVPPVVINNPHDNSSDQQVVDKQSLYQTDDVPSPKYVNELQHDQLQNWNNYKNYPQYPHPVQYHQHVTGYSPGSPIASTNRASGELVRSILSEIVNEYGQDNTMTPGHIEQLLNQRLQTRYNIK